MREYIGKCYYCKGDVFHEKPYDYGAFTKKYDKKSQSYVIADAWHMECYQKKMNEAMDSMRRVQMREEYKQMSLFD